MKVEVRAILMRPLRGRYMNRLNMMLIALIFILMSSQVTADNDRLQKEPDHLYICTFNVYILGNVEAKYTDYESIGDEVIDPNVVPQRIKNLANVLAVGNFDLVCIQEVTAGEKEEWPVII